MKKNIYQAIFLCAAFLTVTVSCSKEQSSEPVYSDTPIVLGASFPEMEVSASTSTKATDNTAEVTSLSSFKVSCVSGSSESNVWENVTFSGSTSFTSPANNKKYWPYNTAAYRFYATNASENMSYAASGTTVVATNTQDVVCAYMSSSTYKGTASQNQLTFNHIFGRLAGVTVAPATGYALSNVTVTITPNTRGTYNMKTGAWSGKTSERSYTVASASSVAAGGSSTTTNNIYVVPDSYTLTATWTATIGDWSNTYTAKVSTSSVPFVAGHITSVTITLGGNAQEISLGYTISAWVTDSTPTAITFPTE